MTLIHRFLPAAALALATFVSGGQRALGQAPAAEARPPQAPAEVSAAGPAAGPVIPAGFVSRQTRIFVPNRAPYAAENWAETVMGRVIAPLVAKFPELRWYWFSRYVQPLEGGDAGDTDIAKLPADFMLDVPGTELQVHRSLRLRFCVPEAKRAEFEAFGAELIKAEGCFISDWRDWDMVADVASGRHLGEDRSPERQARRAERVVRFYHATSGLTLDNLIGPAADGSYRFEKNEDPGAPLGSSFATPHHVFCNITEVPLCVLVTSDGNGIAIGTFSSPPPEGTRKLGQVRVRF